MSASSSSTSAAVENDRVLPVFFADGQLELLEQDASELRRRVDVELLAGQLVDARRVAGELLFDVPRADGQRRPVDEDAGALDVGQHRHERHLELAHDRDRVAPRDTRARQRPGELPRQVGPFAGEVEDRLRRQAAKRLRLRALAADLVLGQRAIPELLERAVLDGMTGSCRVEQIAGDHRVERDAAQRDVVIAPGR